jgi:hypothetical protein
MNRLPTAAAAQRFPQEHGACTSRPVVDDLEIRQWMRHGRHKANVMRAETIKEKYSK